MLKNKLALAVLILSAMVISACSPKSGEYDAFEKCLTESGVIMYGTEWCPHCKDQKALFGKSFQYVNYVDCDRQRQACIEAGVQGYPTWDIEGKLYSGTQPLFRLSSLSGCSVSPEEGSNLTQ